jgi:tRNA modification GTPase
LRFPGPESFTGEDSFELHIHGGRAVAAGVLGALGLCEGLRPAEPGEFARRAFLNGKLDLTEAEGLADLIEATTSAQRDQALLLAGGRLRDQAQAWRSAILALQAQAEAAIDFSDEGDVPADVWDGFVAAVQSLGAQMTAALADGRRGEILRNGFTVVLAGAPNAGKSSLMNALARRDVAIVSSIPGTTRDLIEVSFDLEGMPVILVDTAGVRDAADEIEQEGIRRTKARASAADLVLWLTAPDHLGDADLVTEAPVLRIETKSDLRSIESDPKQGLRLSARTGEGVDALLSLIADRARGALRPEEPALISRERHRIALREAGEALGRIRSGLPVEVAAEELRIAARALAGMIGLVGPEDVLGEIFSRFCIGK